MRKNKTGSLFNSKDLCAALHLPVFTSFEQNVKFHLTCLHCFMHYTECIIHVGLQHIHMTDSNVDKPKLNGPVFLTSSMFLSTLQPPQRAAFLPEVCIHGLPNGPSDCHPDDITKQEQAKECQDFKSRWFLGTANHCSLYLHLKPRRNKDLHIFSCFNKQAINYPGTTRTKTSYGRKVGMSNHQRGTCGS